MVAELVAVADGVFTWLHDVHDRLAANVGVVVDDDGVTLIDSGGLPSSYVRLVRQLEVFDRPVVRIVLTHDHPDHVGGAGAGVFGDVPVFASKDTAHALDQPPLIDALKLLHPTAADEVSDLRNPNVTHVVETTLDIGRLRIEELPGHTGGDIIVTVGDTDTVFAGDLCFFDCMPLGLSANFQRWQASLQSLAERRPQRVVPGHGPVGGVDQVIEVADYIESLLIDAESGKLQSSPTALWRTWYDLWADRVPHATHRMNLEHAAQPEEIPSTLLQLLKPTHDEEI